MCEDDHLNANILPATGGQTPGKRLSGAGTLLVLLLGLTGLYAIARTVDIVDRLHFISKVESGEFAREINSGTLTTQQFQDRAHAIDSRSKAFVTISWVVTVALFLGYRSWQSRSTPRRLPGDKLWMGKLAGLLWIIVVATQFSRYLITGDSLSAIKTSSYVNLVSRALIIPAVILSYLVVREREREPSQAQA